MFSKEKLSRRSLFVNVRGPRGARGSEPTQPASQQESGCTMKREIFERKKEIPASSNLPKPAWARFACSLMELRSDPNYQLTLTHVHILQLQRQSSDASSSNRAFSPALSSPPRWLLGRLDVHWERRRKKTPLGSSPSTVWSPSERSSVLSAATGHPSGR